MPVCYIIAGPNGAGKTTFAREFLPNDAKCIAFVNSDLIAAGLSPFNPDLMQLRAGRMMLEEMHRLREMKVDFAFETTLAGKGHYRFLLEAKQLGYQLYLCYFFMEDVESHILRVAWRVNHGGHNIPEETIRRRYVRSLANLKNIYLPIMDAVRIMETSSRFPKLVAEKSEGRYLIHDEDRFRKLAPEGN